MQDETESQKKPEEQPNCCRDCNRWKPWVADLGHCLNDWGVTSETESCERFEVKVIDYEQKYHEIMDALKRSKRQHGDCRSGKRYNGLPKACSACMANLEIEEELSKYKGRTIKSC